MRFFSPKLGKFRTRFFSRATAKSRGPLVEPLESRHLLAGDLFAHWRADDLTSQVADGEAIAAWNDSTDTISALSIGNPTLVSQGLGGRAVVRFTPEDGADGFRIRATSNPFVNKQAFSVAIAFATDASNLQGANAEWFHNTGLVDSNARGFSTDWGITLNANGQVSAGFGAGFLAPTTTVYSTLQGLNDGDLHVVVLTRDGSSLALYVDDQPADLRNDANADLRAPLDITFGILQDETNPFPGDIADIGFYDGALTADEVGQVIGDLRSYYSNELPSTRNDEYTLTEDAALFFTTAANGVLANDTDAEGDELTASLVSGPENGELGFNSDGSFVYTPQKDFFGTDTFTYTANDFRPSEVARVDLNVEPTYDPATAEDDLYKTFPGELLQVDATGGVLANDTNPDRSELTATLVQDVPQGQLTFNVDGSFAYDPLDFAGTTSFSYFVNDGVTDSAPATVTLRVNRSPQATADQFQIDEDQELVIDAANGVLSNDSDPEQDVLTARLISEPTHGTLQLSPDGSFVYQATADYFGPDEFVYIADDGVDTSEPVAVRIEVVAVNDAPTVVADSYTVDDGILQVATIDGLLANDQDVDDPDFTAMLEDAPLHGEVFIDPNGSFTYLPATGFAGIDRFSYRASDSLVASQPVSVSVIVTESSLPTSNAAGDSVVSFNEIMYHPAGETASEQEWIEIHNQLTVNVDLSDWQIVDGILYEFPRGTTIPADGYIVVARDPNSLQGIVDENRLFGPYRGRLANEGEQIRLLNNSKRVMDAIQYDDGGQWPVAADGSGASLAKLSPRTGSGYAKNWGFSHQIGGTPGTSNFEQSDPVNSQASSLLFNEIGSDEELWVELANPTDEPIDLAGTVISSSADAAREFELASGSLAPGEFLLLNAAELGLDAVDGDALFLYGNNKATVFDGWNVASQVQGRSEQLDGRWAFARSATPGTGNQIGLRDEIVINEIHYHHQPQLETDETPFVESNEEWIELLNRSDGVVDLSNWKIDDGIRFDFEDGTTLQPGELIVISNEAESLRSKYPNARILGDFRGTLSNKTDTILLLDEVGNIADEVTYFDGINWPKYADGNGSSLELRDPDADNRRAEVWQASDETGRSSWQTVTYRGVSGRPTGSNDPRVWNEFVFGLLDAGELLIDDISVVEDPDGRAEELIQDGSFDRGTDTYRLVGNHGDHGFSTIVDDPDAPGNSVLHLVATGATEHMSNHVETTFLGNHVLPSNETYEVSFRVKWLGGSRQLHSRFYFNQASTLTVLDVSDQSGTPGQPNSTFEENLGPTFNHFGHSPLIPAIDQEVTITATAEDPDGVSAMNLWYSVRGRDWIEVAMTDEGSGQYSAVIPGETRGTEVQFYVEAIDGLGTLASFPADGRDSRAMYKVESRRQDPGNHHLFQIIMTRVDSRDQTTRTRVMSNDRVGATVIADGKAYYDVGVRLRGSGFGRAGGRRGYSVQFHPDELFRDIHRAISIDRQGGPHAPGDGASHRELVLKHIATSAGNIPTMYDNVVHFLPPDSTFAGPAQLMMARYDEAFLESTYNDGADGTRFKFELIYYSTQTQGNGVEDVKLPPANFPQGIFPVLGAEFRDMGDNKNNYRWFFLIKNNRARDDYSGIMEMGKALSLRGSTNGGELDIRSQAVMDVDQWSRTFAYESLGGIADTYNQGLPHNLQVFVRPDDGRVVPLPWDQDHSFHSSLVSAGPLGSGSNVGRVFRIPNNEHYYLGHMWDIMQTTYNREYLDPWIEHYAELAYDNATSALQTYIDRRLNTLMRRLPDQVEFSIAHDGPITVDDTKVTLSGNGWIDVREIRIAGQVEPISVVWDDELWVAELPIPPGETDLQLQAYDLQGKLVGADGVTVISTVVDRPLQDFLRIDEMSYNPTDPTLDETANGHSNNDDFEFVELINVSQGDSAVSLDLSGVAFTEGIRFVFEDTTIEPGERVILVADSAAFRQRFGDSPRIVGEYDGSLANGGERIRLIDSDGTSILDFVYDDSDAWPQAADGGGSSLQLIDSATTPPDSYDDPTRWTSGTPSPGREGNVSADFDGDGQITAADIDLLGAAIRSGDVLFDLNGDNSIDQADLLHLVETILSTTIGDANLDGVFDSSDLVLVFAAGQYEDGIENNSGWAEGDWNGDGEFDSEDLVFTFQFGIFTP